MRGVAWRAGLRLAAAAAAGAAAAGCPCASDGSAGPRLPLSAPSPPRSLTMEEYLGDIGRKQVQCSTAVPLGLQLASRATRPSRGLRTRPVSHPCPPANPPQAPNFGPDSRRLIYQLFQAYEQAGARA